MLATVSPQEQQIIYSAIESIKTSQDFICNYLLMKVFTNA